MDAAEVRGHVVHLFPGRGDGRTTKVGVEHELLTRDAVDGAAVQPQRIESAAVGRSYATRLAFEPGGQVELNLPCARSAAVLHRQLMSDLAALRADCARVGRSSTPGLRTTAASTTSRSSCARPGTSPCRATSTRSARPVVG
jgi:hypothetical protein